ncbi:MAG: transposase [Nostoc sp. SerVER01]
MYVEFRQHDCLACPVRNQCTHAKTNPRGLTIQVQSEYEALQKAITAAAINLSRVFAWLEQIPLAKTRSSHFARLPDSTVR